MSFDQRLISKCDQGIFSTIWAASTGNNSLIKARQRHDIETVNVPATCDHLRLAVKTLSLNESTHAEKSCSMPTEMHIPFRIISSLCYGTLLVYQEQVNRLLELSRDLAIHSGTAIVRNSYAGTKRKASASTYTGLVKKSRVVHKPTQRTAFISSYNELLHEVETLKQWSQQQNSVIDETPLDHLSGIGNSNSDGPFFKHITVREITVREFSADFEAPGLEDDEQGFGNATAEELNEFVSLFADKRGAPLASNPLKRKGALDYTAGKKAAKPCNDDTLELARCVTENTILSPVGITDVTDANVNLSLPLNSTENLLSDMTSLEAELNTTANEGCIRETEFIHNNTTVLQPTNCNSPHVDAVESSAINMSAVTNKQRKRKLILDESISFTAAELREQMSHAAKLQRPSRMTLPRKKLSNGHELLSCRSSRLLPCRNSRSIDKVKRRSKTLSDNEAFEREYLSILRAIFGVSACNEQLANAVYPQWQCQGRRQKSRSKRRHSAYEITEQNELQQPPPPICEIAELNNNAMECAAQIRNEQQICNNNPRSGKSAHIAAPLDWSPYGVMMQLLDIWRHSDEDAIDAKQFCLSADNRVNAAAAFSALMSLAAQDFINISKLGDTLEMATITLGSASEKLIQDLKLQRRQA